MNFEGSVSLIISALAGLFGVPVVEVIKNWLKVDGKTAVAIATIVSIVLAFVSVFLSGQFTGADLDLQKLVEASGIVFSVATLFYKSMTSSK